jgi:hypothetical protein
LMRLYDFFCDTSALDPKKTKCSMGIERARRWNERIYFN